MRVFDNKGNPAMLATFYGNPVCAFAFGGDYRIKLSSVNRLDVINLDEFFEGSAGEIMGQARQFPREDSPKSNHRKRWVEFTLRSSLFGVAALDGRN